jgi:hypothetical protein
MWVKKGAQLRRLREQVGSVHAAYDSKAKYCGMDVSEA